MRKRTTMYVVFLPCHSKNYTIHISNPYTSDIGQLPELHNEGTSLKLFMREYNVRIVDKFHVMTVEWRAF
jgi:hypothetical protein